MFKGIENRAVDGAIARQEAAGLSVVTDGEMRRLSFQTHFLEAVTGFGDWGLDALLWGDWHGDDAVGDHSTARPEKIGVVEKLRVRRFISADEFIYLRDHTTKTPKINLPSPSLFANFWSPDISSDAYPRLADFLEDVAEILQDEVIELARLGARYIQIDAPHYPLLISPETRAFYESRGWRADEWLEMGIALDNHVMSAASEVTFGFHLCRGNQASRWLVEGGYDPIAEKIFGSIVAQRLLLEYDDDRSGSFQPLRYVPDDKVVVLGLVSTKSGRLEDADAIIERIEDAARYHPKNQLALSPQCGFATSVLGNNLSVEEQSRKLNFVTDMAAQAWP